MKRVLFILYNLSMAAILLYLANHFLGLFFIPRWIVYTILVVGAISFFGNAMVRRSEIRKQRDDEKNMKD
ncbi:hypothetical protein [Anditalea andensis]|uniref:hypothetical protein n=1 Tax=Anditalea andensis TaxID=1048983 RepID=UPI0013E09BFC|nr:hypothetical protein [Anditalea andensis]